MLFSQVHNMASKHVERLRSTMPQLLTRPCTRRLLAATAALTLLGLLVLLQPGLRYHVLQWSHPDQLWSSSAHCKAMASSKNGMCRFQYTVTDWDGNEVLACDASLCAGQQHLQHMADPVYPQQRWSAFHEALYHQKIKSKAILGWLHQAHTTFVKLLTQEQHRLGVFGSVGEIGVHMGKFFAPIAGFALEDEIAMAIDLFEDQNSNYDKSGASFCCWTFTAANKNASQPLH